MSITKDLKKSILKHSVIRYLDYAEREDEIVNLILDKNMSLLLEENRRLKEENTQLKIDGVFAVDEEIDLEINGNQMTLTKEELIQLVAKYKEKELIESKSKRIKDNVFIPQDIVAIETDSYNMNGFLVYYQNEFTKTYSYITSNDFQKLRLFFDLFNLEFSERNSTTFLLHNKKEEEITVSTDTVLTKEFLMNFAKGKEYIQHNKEIH